MSLIKDIFSKYTYPENRLKDLTITYIHRGAPGDRKTISAEYTKVGRAYFEFIEDGEVVHIPFHRILEIRYKGILVYRKARNLFNLQKPK